MKRFILYLLVLLFMGCSHKETPDHSFTYEEIRYTDKMVFATMSLTKTVKTDRSDWYKIGKRIAVYSYDTYLEAFVDLSRLQPDDLIFDEKEDIVTLILPPVETRINGRDIELHKEYENIGVLRSEIDSKERAQMKEIANASLKKELAGNPEYKKVLQETARNKARTYFTRLLEKTGYKPVVKFSDDQPLNRNDYDIRNYD